jgi:hypothetical protein
MGARDDVERGQRRRRVPDARDQAEDCVDPEADRRERDAVAGVEHPGKRLELTDLPLGAGRRLEPIAGQ